MKRLLRIFELSKNEQRVVLIVMLVLIALAFVGHMRRTNQLHIRAPAAPEMKTSPSPVQTEYEQ